MESVENIVIAQWNQLKLSYLWIIRKILNHF